MRARTLLCVCIVLSFVCVAHANAATVFQRMRISSGTYPISPSSPSVPAACLDLHRPTPTAFDTFGGLPPAASVTRTNAAGVKDSLPLDKAAAAGWVRVSGNGTHWSIDVTPLNPPKGTVYELSVHDQFGVFGVNPNDANDAAKALRERLLKVSGQIDSFADELHKSFGENSGLTREFLRRTQDLQWRFLDAKEDPDDLADAAKSVLDDFKDTLTGGDAEETWENLSVFQARPLTPEEAVAAAKLLETKVTTSTDKDFLESLDRLTKAKQKLDAAFGRDDAVTVAFHRGVIRRFELDDLKDSLYGVADKLVPPELDGKPEALDVLELMQGRSISDTQAAALAEVTGRKLPKSRTGCLDSHLVVTTGGNELILQTTTQRAYFSLKDFTSADLKTWLGKHPRVVTQGQITEPVAQMLSDSGVKVVGDFEDVIRNPQPKAKRPFLIFAMSADPDAATRFMAGADTKQFVQAAKLAAELPSSYSCLVSSKDELTKKLKSLADDQFPVVVFNNTDDGIAFPDGAMSPEELAEKAYGLACNTFKAGLLGYETTDFIDPVSTVKAAKAAVESGGIGGGAGAGGAGGGGAGGAGGGGGGGGGFRPDDFFNSWAAFHDKEVNRKKKFILASIGSGAGGAILGGILLALESSTSQPATKPGNNEPNATSTERAKQ